MAENLPAAAIADLLKTAAETLAPDTGETAAAAESVRAAGSSDGVVILCDISSSMGIRDDRSQQRTRHDHLREALTDLLVALPAAQALAFNTEHHLLKSVADLPNPWGGTRLRTALARARDKMAAKRILVISDGRPEAPTLCLGEAKLFKGRIDTVYCGPEDDEALKFLQDLCDAAGTAGGSVSRADLATAAIGGPSPLLTQTRKALGLPAPKES